MSRLTLLLSAFVLGMTCSAQTSEKITKGYHNPIIDHTFTADPTAVEYEGRIYVYGTNDHEQYLNAEKNGYEKIKTLAMMSSDDMVNWTYHGLIPVGQLAPWIINSWAPSITSRIEEDGKTLFWACIHLICLQERLIYYGPNNHNLEPFVEHLHSLLGAEVVGGRVAIQRVVSKLTKLKVTELVDFSAFPLHLREQMQKYRTIFLYVKRCLDPLLGETL